MQKSKRKLVTSLPRPISPGELAFLRTASENETSSAKDSKKRQRHRTLPREVISRASSMSGAESPSKRKKKKTGALRVKTSKKHSDIDFFEAVDAQSASNLISNTTTVHSSPEIQVMVRSTSYDVTSEYQRPNKEKPVKEKKSSKWFSKKSSKSKNKQKTVFGSSIADLVHDPQNTSEIPIIIRQCVDYLMTEDAHLVSGIFRQSGSFETIEKIKKMYDSPKAEPDLSFCTDPHCIASLLKQFLASMSEPVIPFSEYDRIITNFNHFKENHERTGVLRNFVNTLPEANKNVLFYLLRFLTRVEGNSDSNMMTAKNLGVVFAPTLLRPEIHTPENLQDLTNTEIVSHMINHYREIFHQPN